MNEIDEKLTILQEQLDVETENLELHGTRRTWQSIILGMSQKALAKLAGVPESTVFLIDTKYTGDVGPTLNIYEEKRQGKHHCKRIQ